MSRGFRRARPRTGCRGGAPASPGHARRQGTPCTREGSRRLRIRDLSWVLPRPNAGTPRALSPRRPPEPCRKVRSATSIWPRR
ncbi:protein of unassigned function [Methylobacterium oryzae CBMB20]|uniref:Protein of unassigned function n=1 Tax=Methylobacterium oryzae CBMB20 TaxID=693986 RepID=A0A089NQL4_9HYPH|nr:protein of unassigned function [Methylobacterium oryzae CBMB20]